ncbi:hypothetical protein ACU21_07280 [Actinobaculum suis]|nr:hypothetical protein ACU21_07280 [Actinobaculum suis]OCA95168.1 hypothetical protein ACU20_05265 [Actinobaculum suis]
MRPADSRLPEPRSSEPPLAESRPAEPRSSESRSSETPQVSESIPVRVTLLADFVALLVCVAFTAVFILTSGFPISFPPTGTAAWVTAGLAFLSGVLAVYAITARAKIPNPHLARGLAWAMLAIATIAGALGKISAMPVLAGMGVVIVFLAQMARPVPAGTLVSQLAVSYLAIAVAISAGLWPASLHLVGGEMAGTIMAESLLCMAVVRIILGRIASWWPYLLVAFAGGLGAGWAYSTITGATAWATLTAGPVWLAIVPALLYPLSDYYSGVLAEKLSLTSPQTTAEEKTAGEDGVVAPAVENSETTKTARARETSRARENEASENNATGRTSIGWLTQAGVELAVVSVCGWLAFGIAAIIA